MLLVKLFISAAIPDVPHHVAVQVPASGHGEEAGDNDYHDDDNDDDNDDDDDDNESLFDPAGKGRVQAEAT